MKKILAAILCAGLVAVTAAGCGYTDALAEAKRAQNTTSAAQESQQETKPKEIKSTDYKNNLEGLVEYFDKKEYIANEEKNITVMDAASIGAKQGKKFAASYDGKNISIELYEYDTEKLNGTANKILNEIKSDGSFSVYNLPAVPAYISDNGKFMMVYTDASISKDNPDKTAANYEHREQVIKDFKEFNK